MLFVMCVEIWIASKIAVNADWLIAKSIVISIFPRLVKKGQPPTLIYAEHENEMPVCLRTLYNYTDFEYAMKVKYTEEKVVEMDTVKGIRKQGKRLLSMIFRKNNVMLLFLMLGRKAESVKRGGDYLETELGIAIFRRLFPVILTDNGSEFKKVDESELTSDKDGFLVYRTSLFFCDPMASWQKGRIEKNHEFTRYAIPRKRSLNPYNQYDITLLMNHINSIKRPELGNKCPYELMRVLKMHIIPPDKVHLMPDLFIKK